MSVPITTSPGVPDTVDEVVTDPGWLAERDQAMAARHRTTLHTYGGSVLDEVTADEQGVSR